LIAWRFDPVSMNYGSMSSLFRSFWCSHYWHFLLGGACFWCCGGSVQEESGPWMGRLTGAHGGAESWTGSTRRHTLGEPRECHRFHIAIKSTVPRIHSSLADDGGLHDVAFERAAHVGRRLCCRARPRLKPTNLQPATLCVMRNASSFLSMVHASSNIRRATATTAILRPRLAATRSNIA